jgi:hypothetical protein
MQSKEGRKMKNYLEPSVTLLALRSEDVITASGDIDTPANIKSAIDHNSSFGGFNEFE